MTVKPTSIRLSDDAKTLQKLLAQQLGVSQHAILELAIRAFAEQKGIKLEKSKKERRGGNPDL